MPRRKTRPSLWAQVLTVIHDAKPCEMTWHEFIIYVAICALCVAMFIGGWVCSS